MSILDRHILRRFAANFFMLFALLFIFAISTDLILTLDKYVKAAKDAAGDDAGVVAVSVALIKLMVDFQGPRVFQFYAYLHGLVAIGAMGFTLAQMHRHRELVAIMSAGTSLYRVAMPFIVAVFGLSLLQLLNQELILPRVAPLLLRDHGHIGESGVDRFEVQFTPDSRGNLLQAPSFDPATLTLTAPTFLELDDAGRTQRRITASSAVWSDQDQAWFLSESVALRQRGEHEATPENVLLKEQLQKYQTDLTPQVLLVRRFNQFATMLSLNQIRQMLETPHVSDRAALLRYAYSRFSSVLVNLFVLGLTLPCFLLREPANLLRQSVLAASLAIPATLGSAIGMMISLPGIAPALGVFLPVIVLMFMSLFPWTYFKT